MSTRTRRKPRDLEAKIEALQERMEDIEDALRASEILARTRIEDCLPVELVERRLAGEHPVRIWREHRALSMTALAEKAGLPLSYVSEIENGKKPGSVAALKALATALDLAIDDIAP